MEILSQDRHTLLFENGVALRIEKRNEKYTLYAYVIDGGRKIVMGNFGDIEQAEQALADIWLGNKGTRYKVKPDTAEGIYGE